MKLHQIKKLPHIKENEYKNGKTTHRMGEKLCKLFITQMIDI
jgi:hypothetical protein